MRYLRDRELRAADARTKKARQQEALERKAKKQARRAATRSLPNATKMAEKIRAQTDGNPGRRRQ